MGKIVVGGILLLDVSLLTRFVATRRIGKDYQTAYETFSRSNQISGLLLLDPRN